MTSLEKQKLRSLGKNLTLTERLVIMETKKIIKLRYMTSGEVIEKHNEIFGFTVTKEELEKSLEEVIFL